MENVRELPSSAPRDRDRLVPLIVEVTAEGHSVLVFCATRKSCETCADMVAELLHQVAPTGESEASSSSNAFAWVAWLVSWYSGGFAALRLRLQS